MSYNKGFNFANITEYCERYKCKLLTQEDELDEKTKIIEVESCCGHKSTISFRKLFIGKIGIYCDKCFKNNKNNGFKCFNCNKEYNYGIYKSIIYCSKQCQINYISSSESFKTKIKTIMRLKNGKCDENGVAFNDEVMKAINNEKQIKKRRDAGIKEREFITYEIINKKYEKEGCILLTSEKEYNELTQDKDLNQINFKIKCSCGHVIDDSLYYTFKDRGTGILCKECTKNEAIKKAVSFSKTDGIPTCALIETKGVDIIGDLCKDLEVIKTREACDADLLVRPIDSKIDSWLKIQLKTTTSNKNITAFNITREYKDMIIIFICTKNKDVWLFDCKDIRVQKYHMGKVESMYDKYKITNLQEEILKWYDKKIYNTTFLAGDTPIAPRAQLEYKYVLIRENNIKFLNFTRNEIDGLVYDFKVNNKKVQEKVVTEHNNKLAIVLSKRVNGKKSTKVSYAESDNDFYWLNLNDESLDFYVLPESTLISERIVSTTTQPAEKKTLSFLKNKNWLDKYKFNYNTINDEPNKTKLINLIETGELPRDDNQQNLPTPLPLEHPLDDLDDTEDELPKKKKKSKSI